MLEEMLEDPEKLNRAVYDVITASDLNNDQQLSRAEFQVGIHRRALFKQTVIRLFEMFIPYSS